MGMMDVDIMGMAMHACSSLMSGRSLKVYFCTFSWRGTACHWSGMFGSSCRTAPRISPVRRF